MHPITPAEARERAVNVVRYLERTGPREVWLLAEEIARQRGRDISAVAGELGEHFAQLRAVIEPLTKRYKIQPEEIE